MHILCPSLWCMLKCFQKYIIEQKHFTLAKIFWTHIMLISRGLECSISHFTCQSASLSGWKTQLVCGYCNTVNIYILVQLREMFPTGLMWLWTPQGFWAHGEWLKIKQLNWLSDPLSIFLLCFYCLSRSAASLGLICECSPILFIAISRTTKISQQWRKMFRTWNVTGTGWTMTPTNIIVKKHHSELK